MVIFCFFLVLQTQGKARSPWYTRDWSLWWTCLDLPYDRCASGAVPWVPYGAMCYVATRIFFGSSWVIWYVRFCQIPCGIRMKQQNVSICWEDPTLASLKWSLKNYQQLIGEYFHVTPLSVLQDSFSRRTTQQECVLRWASGFGGGHGQRKLVCLGVRGVLARIFQQRMSNDTDLPLFWRWKKRRFFGGFARFRMSRWKKKVAMVLLPWWSGWWFQRWLDHFP